jgi:hypothetical protein
MVDGQGTNDDALFEQLRAAGGTAAFEALRARYDALRADYAALLDRLDDLERRATSAEPAARARPSGVSSPATGLLDALMAPLEALRGEYAEALAGIRNVVDTLDTLVGSGLRPQRVAASASAPSQLRVEARAQGAASLLAFRDRLAAMPGVRRASIHAADQERATFVVELEP